MHRREGDVDFFFVAGEGKGEVELNASCEGRTVEIWDALKCGRARCPHRAASNGKTRVSLDLPVGGSCFIVFAPNCRQTGLTGFTGLDGIASQDSINPVNHVNPVKKTFPVTNAWRVSFAYHDGISAAPPVPVAMDKLCDWTTYGEDGIRSSTSLRYFSGTAIYRTIFSYLHNSIFPQFHNSTITLSLGHVPTGLAHVFVNGIDCGVAWCAPWEVEVSSAIREGENKIEIRYTNNWYNRLVGDCFLPERERVTRSTLRYWTMPRECSDSKRPWLLKPRVYSGPAISDSLQPSGLLGPVVIRGG